jgi:hypothetical protein
MVLDKKKEVGELKKGRLDRDKDLDGKMKKEKDDELKTIKDNRDKADAEFKGMSDL